MKKVVQADPSVIPEVQRAAAKGVEQGVKRGDVALGRLLTAIVLGTIAFLAVTLIALVGQKFSSQPTAKQSERPAAIRLQKDAQIKADPCAQTQAARMRLLNYNPSLPDLPHVAQARAEITDLRNKLQAAAKAEECDLAVKDRDYPNQTLEESAIDFVVARDPRLIPMPEPRGETFDHADFTRLGEFTSTALPEPKSASTLSLPEALDGYWRTSNRISQLSALIAKLRKARGSGRVTQDSDGDFPTGVNFARMASDVATDLDAASRVVERATAQKAIYRAVASKQLVIWGGAVPIVALLLLAIRNWRKQRRDNHRFEKLKAASVQVLCSELTNSGMSDNLRWRANAPRPAARKRRACRRATARRIGADPERRPLGARHQVRPRSWQCRS